MPTNRKAALQLRPYQQETYEGVMKEWSEGRKRALIVSPTGSGKTTIMGAIIRHEVEHGGKVLVVTDRKKLTRQFAHRTEQDFGIPCGIEISGEGNEGERVVCATIQTITNRINEGKFRSGDFTLLAFDEAHLSLAASWQHVSRHFSSARIVGLTATPRRGDKRDLMKFYDGMVEPVTLNELIERGHLAPLTIHNIPITIRIEREGKGDFDEEEINHVIEPHLEACADVMAKEGKRRCCLSFLPLIATSIKFTAMLNKRGMKTEHVDGTMDEREINAAIRRLEMGEIQCLSCSQILGVGVDIRPVSLICNLRPTRSWTMFVQFCGRGTRTHDPAEHGPKGTKWPLKRDCVLLDPLWLTSDHNLLMRPAVLVAENDEELESIDAKLRKSGGGDLMEARRSARADHEERLRARLEAMQRRKSRLVNAMDFFLNSHRPDLVEWEPLSRGELEGITPKQREALARNGFDLETIQGRGHADKILDTIFQRIRKGLATVKMARYAADLGMEGAWDRPFIEVSQWISQHAQPRRAGLGGRLPPVLPKPGSGGIRASRGNEPKVSSEFDSGVATAPTNGERRSWWRRFFE